MLSCSEMISSLVSELMQYLETHNSRMSFTPKSILYILTQITKQVHIFSKYFLTLTMIQLSSTCTKRVKITQLLLQQLHKFKFPYRHIWSQHEKWRSIWIIGSTVLKITLKSLRKSCQIFIFYAKVKNLKKEYFF